MATTTSQGAAKSTSGGVSKSRTFQDTVANITLDYIATTPYFPNLAKLFRGGYPIVAVMMGIFQRESSWRPAVYASESASLGQGTTGASVATDIKSKFGVNVNLGIPAHMLVFRGLGLGQCMGWYLIKGTRTCLEMHGSGAFAPLCNGLGLLVNFGDSPLAAFQDTTPTAGGRGPYDTKGLRASIVASLVVMEKKLELFYSPKKTADTWVFDAVGGYIGTGKRDSLGTTPVAYKNQVRQYAAAFSSGKGTTVASSSPPTSSSGDTAAVASGGAGKITDLLHCPQAQA